MSESPLWASDQPIYDLIGRMSAEAAELMEDPAARLDMENRLYAVASNVLSISPPVVWDLFTGYSYILHEGHVGELDETLGYVDRSLEDWNGAAADAFRAHMGRLEHFLGSQRRHVEMLLRFFLAAYALAIQARDDMKIAMEGWIDLSRQFRDDEEEKRLSTTIKIGAALVGGAVAIVTGGTTLVLMGLAATAAGVTAAAEGITAPLGGTSKEELFASAEKALATLDAQYKDGIEKLNSEVRSYAHREVDAHVDLFEPLPVVTDVDSPEFRYEDFHHRAHFSESFAAEVDRQHEAHAEAKGSNGGLIGRRLAGDDSAS